ncbi:YfhO family protein [Cellulophaga sp. Hel_I_12]|uniref:YfhO family protein n=1 Tax=Cellulophaga sp. Hel_I_12 TaxID=1249972 RepID=UPI000647D68B|nr:YfhO family protein [Cellulophaga sp. Hel_I_12]
MKRNLRAFLIHFFAIALFIVAALAFFTPVLQGKVIFQSDIAQYTGMAQEQIEFKKRTGEEPYWTNSAFGGMPTFQLGAHYPHNYIKQLDLSLRFLPRPADYLFLYLLGFYILLSCLKVDYRLAVLGALAFGFSTYLIIILGVGHNAKAHAIAYLPMLLGGIVLVFRKKYVWGFILTALAMALEINANHYQMTYYFMLLVLILGVVYLVDAVRKKQVKHFMASLALLLIAVILGIATNATSLLATKEYADWSTRGKSELTITPDGTEKVNTGGLSKEYITQYSYGITESLNLFVPRLFGGSNSEDLGEDSKTFEFLVEKGISKSKALDFTSGMPLYWGDQPGTSAPAYVGAVLFFLFFLGLFLVQKKAKWWLLGGVIMSLILSWGKNFSLLTDFMIDYFPLYDKFRAVSSIQVILELCVPILAILALAALFDTSIEKAKKLKALKTSFSITFGLGILIFISKGLFHFEGASDSFLEQNYGNELMTMIRLDREAVYTSDTIRSLIYVLLTALVLWFFIKEKFNKNVLVVLVGLLVLFDLVGVAKRYVNDDDFVRAKLMAIPFPETPVDQELKQDKSIFRVYNPAEGLNGASTSYFHQSIGGYHAAKPAKMQDLFDFHIYRGNINVLNMLNVKYVMQQDEDGNTYPAMNPDANGNAWFVTELQEVTTANEEILALKDLDTKNTALVNTAKFNTIQSFDYQKDSLAKITLTTYRPNHLIYEATNSNKGLAVFSEMYYEKGWNAYIDGVLKPHFRVNYALRALEIPLGKHTIEFKFEPQVIQQGSTIVLASTGLLGLLILAAIGFSFWRSGKKGIE